MKLTSIPIALLLLIFCDPLLAKQIGPPGDPLEFVDRYNKRFEKQTPLIGDPVLDGLTAFDEHGKTFAFEELKGKHTVIVFGCLT